MIAQLTLDGREVDHPPRTKRLGPVQREVMRKLGFGSLTSTQAGVICHEIRGHCGHGAKDKGRAYAGKGCCRYAASDGSAVMKRLVERGCVEKSGGLWWHNEGRPLA